MEAIAVHTDVAVPVAESAAQPVSSYSLSTLAALESALAEGLQDAWRRVVDADPLASLFQTAGWCMPWYRAYADAFDPYVLVVNAGDRVAGVVPMAVDRKTRELVFASHSMADYRDIVALPGYREQVVGELIRHYVEGHFSGALSVGWIDPASDTPSLIAKICAQRGLNHTVRQQPCWRWFPVAGENLQKKFSRIRTHLNYFKRQGEVTFDVITGAAEWSAFRDEFYRQHSLRQLQAAREVSFDDPRKQRLYDMLFASPDVPTHVTACRVNGRMIAGHVGLVWRNVLSLGAPSISLEDEQRSPAVILMAWIIQNAAQLGLSGFDLTIGESEFKRRLGNQCVQLTMVDVYRRSSSYYRNRAKARLVSSTRRIVERVAGKDAWEDRIKPAVTAVSHKCGRLRELGLVGSIGKAIAITRGQPARELSLSIARGAFHSAAKAPSAASAEIHRNQVEDLLLWDGDSASTKAALGACARAYGRNRAQNHTLHTLVAGGALAAWCYSRIENGRAVIYEVGGTPESGAEACVALIRQVIGDAFAADADHADVVLLEAQRTIRRVLGRDGFRVGTVE